MDHRRTEIDRLRVALEAERAKVEEFRLKMHAAIDNWTDAQDERDEARGWIISIWSYCAEDVKTYAGRLHDEIDQAVVKWQEDGE